MKNLISSLFFLIPLITFSQYNVHVDNNSALDIQLTIFETSNCSPYSTSGSINRQILSNDNDDFGNSGYMYEILFCEGTTPCSGSIGQPCELRLGYKTGVYSGSFQHCTDGHPVDVTWTTHINCEDISIDIMDK